MLKNLSVLLRYFVFWLSFFFLERLVFVLYNAGRIKSISFVETVKLVAHGMWMDASMTGYICALPLLVFAVLWFFPPYKFPVLLLKIYTSILIVLLSFITVVNFNIYREWGTKINYRALEFAFSSPSEAFSSSESSPVFLSISIFLVLACLGIFLGRLMIAYRLYPGGRPALKILAAVILLGFNFLAIRGGWQLSPMNESMAYFSVKPILNYAAVNTEWSLIHDVLNAKYSKSNPFNYYSKAAAKQKVAELYSKPETASEKVLAVNRPNIVLVLMESHTANVVGSLGGEKSVSPQLDRLASQGISFENIYASGFRTDKGVVAVLSAFPAQNKRSIMKENSKQAKLPAIPLSLAKEGYSNIFFYGGESQFANMKSYLISHAFEDIIDKHTFDSKDMNSKWGAYDGTVYNRMIGELRGRKSPFLATILTLTNHEPFEVPGNPRFPGESLEDKFRSTAFYADSCLGAFIEHAKKEEWYKNTLFVVVADHGHRLPKPNLEIFDPAHYHIPFLLFGEVIKPEFRGRKIAKIGSQTDIAATLLNQLDVNSADFRWSRDLLNPQAKDFSFFNWDYGFGFVTKEQAITYDIKANAVIYRRRGASATDRRLLDDAKACMQEVYQQYVDY